MFEGRRMQVCLPLFALPFRKQRPERLLLLLILVHALPLHLLLSLLQSIHKPLIL